MRTREALRTFGSDVPRSRARIHPQRGAVRGRQELTDRLNATAMRIRCFPARSAVRAKKRAPRERGPFYSVVRELTTVRGDGGFAPLDCAQRLRVALR